MNVPNEYLVAILKFCAVVQIGVAILNLFLPRLLNWHAELKKLSLLPREVFHVHLWFISLVLLIFGVMTWRFATDIANGSELIGRWLAASIGLFWGIRTVVQVTYYSSEHWRGKIPRTIAHVILLGMYFTLSASYIVAAL